MTHAAETKILQIPLTIAWGQIKLLVLNHQSPFIVSSNLISKIVSLKGDVRGQHGTGYCPSAFLVCHFRRIRILFTMHTSHLSPEKTMTEVGTKKERNTRSFFLYQLVILFSHFMGRVYAHSRVHSVSITFLGNQVNVPVYPHFILIITVVYNHS